MGNKDIISEVSSYLLPVIESHGFELYDIEFVKEGQNWYFRIYIDKEGGVAIEDCELISRAVEKFLDEKDPIQQAYILEVSSAGLDRPLKKAEDFQRYAGRLVDLKLYKAFNKRKEYQGTLKDFKNNVIIIEMENGEELGFNKAEVASCKLAVIF